MCGLTGKEIDSYHIGLWSTLFPAVIAGGGIRGGICYGSTDKDAAYPVDKPVSPEDLACTIYHALGIDPHMHIPDAQGRPVAVVDGGRPLDGIVYIVVRSLRERTASTRSVLATMELPC